MVRFRIGARRATVAPRHARRDAEGSTDAGPRRTPRSDKARIGDALGTRLRRFWGRPRILVILIPLTIVMLVVTALPSRQWLDNRHSIAAAESQLAGIRAANDEASATAESLRSGAELERLAREQYGYSKPGEEVYHVLPAPRDPVRVPDTWPFNALGATLGR
jgi:cell division protein FtsB